MSPIRGTVGKSSSKPPTSPQPRGRPRETTSGNNRVTRSSNKSAGASQESRQSRDPLFSDNSNYGEQGYSSDSTEEDYNSEDNVSVQSLVQGSIASGSPSRRLDPKRTNCRGLALPYQKILIEDIETSGGIEAVRKDFTKWANKQAKKGGIRAQLYGISRSKQRFRVENKVKKWGNLNSTEYVNLLEELVLSDLAPASQLNSNVTSYLPSDVEIPDQEHSKQASLPKKTRQFTTFREPQRIIKTSSDEDKEHRQHIMSDARFKDIGGVLHGTWHYASIYL